MAKKSKYCVWKEDVWKEDEDGIWDTECGHRYEFYDGGPKENRFKYCPYCGKKIIEGS